MKLDFTGRGRRAPGGDDRAPRAAFWCALSVWVLTLAVPRPT